MSDRLTVPGSSRVPAGLARRTSKNARAAPIGLLSLRQYPHSDIYIYMNALRAIKNGRRGHAHPHAHPALSQKKSVPLVCRLPPRRAWPGEAGLRQFAVGEGNGGSGSTSFGLRAAATAILSLTKGQLCNSKPLQRPSKCTMIQINVLGTFFAVTLTTLEGSFQIKKLDCFSSKVQSSRKELFMAQVNLVNFALKLALFAIFA